MNFAINTNKFNLCHLPVTTSHFTTTLLYFSTASKIRKDYYKILGVSRGSSPEQIKEAFYKLSKVFLFVKNFYQNNFKIIVGEVFVIEGSSGSKILIFESGQGSGFPGPETEYFYKMVF